MTDLRELEKRLEDATGPSRELDDAVFRACGFKVYPYDEPSGTTWGAAYPVTKSLDAAVALVERVLPDHWVMIVREDDYGVTKPWRAKIGAEPRGHYGDWSLPKRDAALAVCLAAVRVLIAKGDRHD